MIHKADRPLGPLLLQQGSQLAPSRWASQVIVCPLHMPHSHSELFPGVSACWTENTQQALGLILETTKEAISLLKSVLL